MIALGDKDISNLMLGNTQVTKVMLGEEQMWPNIPYQGFTIIANASSKISLVKLSTYQTLEYSLNNKKWDTFDTTTSVNLESGKKMYVRGILSGDNTYSNYTQFNITGDVSLDGDMSYVWNYENPDAPLKQYCGANMFKECSITSVGNILPSTELANYCYREMFYGSKLQNIPELPAINLCDGCYYCMFENCTSLTEAPELPAKTFVNNCYSYMFRGCTNLNKIKCLAEGSLGSNTSQWTYKVNTKDGTFIKSPNMNDWVINSMYNEYRGIPSGWEIIDADE